MRAVLAHHGRHHPVQGAGRSGERTCELRGARARRHLVRLVPSHGARQGGHREVPAPAAEQMHSGAAGSDQSEADGLRRDVHRQLPRRRPERALWAVQGAEEKADEACDRHRSRAQPDHHQAGNVRKLPHRAPADHAQRQDDRARLRADHLSGMGIQRLPDRRFSRRRAALRVRPAGAVLSGLPHAEQGRLRQPVSQQDRGDPGILKLPAGRAHAAAGGYQSSGALGLRQAHAGRAQRLSPQDGVAVPRHPRHPQERPDAHLNRNRTRSRRPRTRCSIRP